MARKEGASRKSGARLVWWILSRIVIPLALIASLAVGGLYAWRRFSERRVQRLHETLYSQVQQVAELTVLKNSFTDVVSIKASSVMGLAKAYSIVKYRGVTRIGIADVTKVEVSLSDDGKSARIKVPFSEILGNDIVPESLEVFDEKKSVFVPISTQDIFDEIQVDMEENVARLKSEGILLEADAQVRSLVMSMAKAAGVEEVEVVSVF